MKDNYNIFEQYLNGELQGQALADFEQQIKTDSELASELELFRKIRAGISGKLQSETGKKALLKSIGEIEGDYFDDGQQSSDGDTGGGPRIISMGRRAVLTAIAVAASVLLLVFVWQPWQPPQSLYDQYAQFPAAEFTARSTDDIDLQAMQDAFNQKNFTEAIPLFQEYLIKYPDDAEMVLFKGISHLNIGEDDRAMALFARVISGNSAFKNDGRWYLALTYLKLDDISNCKKMLTAIPEGADRYADATELLSKLQ